jgi:copper chaperone
MEEERKELLMQVDGMRSDACTDKVERAIRLLDPAATVTIDLAHGRVAVTTRAQSLEIAEAINKAGFEARAMSL